jgi:hypothetical protein
MSLSIENKLQGMFWDMHPDVRQENVKKIINNPIDAFHDEQLFLKVLNTLGWYEIIQITGSDHLIELLNDATISRIFPEGRRRYYSNAKRLLSKYTLSPSG